MVQQTLSCSVSGTRLGVFGSICQGLRRSSSRLFGNPEPDHAHEAIEGDGFHAAYGLIAIAKTAEVEIATVPSIEGLQRLEELREAALLSRSSSLSLSRSMEVPLQQQSLPTQKRMRVGDSLPEESQPHSFEREQASQSPQQDISQRFPWLQGAPCVSWVYKTAIPQCIKWSPMQAAALLFIILAVERCPSDVLRLVARGMPTRKRKRHSDGDDDWQSFNEDLYLDTGESLAEAGVTFEVRMR